MLLLSSSYPSSSSSSTSSSSSFFFFFFAEHAFQLLAANGKNWAKDQLRYFVHKPMAVKSAGANSKLPGRPSETAPSEACSPRCCLNRAASHLQARLHPSSTLENSRSPIRMRQNVWLPYSRVKGKSKPKLTWPLGTSGHKSGVIVTPSPRPYPPHRPPPHTHPHPPPTPTLHFTAMRYQRHWIHLD